VTTLEIRDIPKGLRIHITEPRRIGRILLEVVFGTAFCTILYRSSSNPRLYTLFFFMIVLVVITRDLISLFRGTNVQLTVNNFALISTGHAPDGYKPSNISRADIYSLEFQQARGGDDLQPSGLYVEYRGGLFGTSTTCVLPHLDKIQTKEVIQAILHRFPDTTTLPPTRPNDSDLISLNLTQPSPPPPSSST
jgi:hypothetical protein